MTQGFHEQALPLFAPQGDEDEALAPGAAKLPSYIADHRKRLRTRFIDGGAAAMPDYEVLELVLFRAIPRMDVKPLARLLLVRPHRRDLHDLRPAVGRGMGAAFIHHPLLGLVFRLGRLLQGYRVRFGFRQGEQLSGLLHPLLGEAAALPQPCDHHHQRKQMDDGQETDDIPKGSHGRVKSMIGGS